ncbi:MAG: cold adaptation protein AtcC, partial [Shewanella sp.]
MQLVLRDPNQGPFLSKVIAYGRDEQLLSDEELAQIKAKAMLMSLKLADKFYNKYKMHLLEQAAFDVIGVVSLGLIALTERNESRALSLLQQNDG